MEEKYTVCILGSGNLASAIAINIGANAENLDLFDSKVNMYVYEEIIDGKKLTDIINTTHENNKYMPNQLLPKNIVAVPDVIKAAKQADIIIFAIPTKIIVDSCAALSGNVKPHAIAVSLSNDIEKRSNNDLLLISHMIMRHLKLPCSVLVGANLINEIVQQQYCEGTLGVREEKYNQVLRSLFETPTFRVEVSNDPDAVEICGILKEIIAFGAGCIDGLGLSENAKSGVIRRGFLEMIQFVDNFCPPTQMKTLLLSCGLSNLIVACNSNRNRRLGECYVKSGRPLAEAKRIVMRYSKTSAPRYAEIIYDALLKHGLNEKFPLLTLIHNLCNGESSPSDLLVTLRHASEFIYHPMYITPL